MKLVKKHIFAFLGFTLVGYYAVFDVLWRFGSMYYGRFADTLGWLWQFWWYKYSWAQGVSGRFVPLRAYPFGVEAKSLYPLWDIFNRWLVVAIGDISAYNLQILLSFVLSGLAVYFLIYSFTKSRLASFFCGCVFTLSPYHFARAWDHLSLSNLYWMIFYIQTLFVFRKSRNLKSALLCGACFGLIGHFSNFYYVYFMIFFSLIFLVFTLIDDKYRQKDILKKQLFSTVNGSLLIFFTSLLMMIPQIWTYLNVIFMKASLQSVSNPVRSFGQLFADSARPLNYFLPSVYHPLLGGAAKLVLDSSLYGKNVGGEQSLYLGILPLILAFIGYKNWRQNNRKKQLLSEDGFVIKFFVFIFFFFMICSFSPYWGVKGVAFIPFPSFFLYEIFPVFRNYARMGVVVLLAVCVLGGFGMKTLLLKMGSKRNRILLSCVLILILLFEFYNNLPFSIDDNNSIPEVYKWLKPKSPNTVIAEYPIDADGRGYLFYQRIHNKAMINGAPPGSYAEVVSKKIVDIKASFTPGVLKFLGTDYVILNKDKYLKGEGGAISGQIPDLSLDKRYKLEKSFEGVDVYSINATGINPDTIPEDIDIRGETGVVPELDEQISAVKIQDIWQYNIKLFDSIPLASGNIRIGSESRFDRKTAVPLYAEFKAAPWLRGMIEAKANLTSLINKKNLFALKYQESFMVNGKVRKKQALFDHKQQLMTTKDRKVRIASGVQDPLSFLYFLTKQDFNQDKSLSVFINPGKTNHQLLIDVIGKETIEINGNKYDCWKLGADLFKIKKDKKKISSLILWVEETGRQRLVKIKAKKKIGSLSISINDSSGSKK